jgi:hypothetical protein
VVLLLTAIAAGAVGQVVSRQRSRKLQVPSAAPPSTSA